jgi:hypothetical protein
MLDLLDLDFLLDLSLLLDLLDLDFLRLLVADLLPLLIRLLDLLYLHHYHHLRHKMDVPEVFLRKT